MANSILKELPELVEAQILSAETADRIRSYYCVKNTSSENRLFLTFGILGSLITGLGIILIIAHNWDDFARQTKTTLAFLPMLVGQLACVFALIKTPSNQTWKECAAAFLFLAIGATISIISQVYHIPGDLSNFLLTWSLLGLPLIYIMRSGMASMLYLIGITYFASQSGYWSYATSETYYFWPLLAAALPFYFLLYSRKPDSNFMYFHNWLVPLSVIISLGTLAKSTEEFMFIAYMSLFGLLLQIGTTSFFHSQKQRNNGFLLLGLSGTIAMLLFLSFDNFWTSLDKETFKFPATITSPEFVVATIITGLATALLIWKIRNTTFTEISLPEAAFLLFILAFIAGYFTPLAGQVSVNILVLALGVFTIRNGARQNHLGILNFGLLFISALVACRFFDTNLTFVSRGILFILVGTGFFVANYYTLKNRKTA